MQMDELIEFLQQTLAVDFYFEDDYVIEQALRENLQELRSSRLHTAGDSKTQLASFINTVFRGIGKVKIPRSH